MPEGDGSFPSAPSSRSSSLGGGPAPELPAAGDSTHPHVEQKDTEQKDVGQSPGELLLAGREANELTIEEVSDALNLAPNTVQWLETDNFASLPAAAFTQGYFRNYAKLVGLDADAVVQAYQGKAGKPEVAWESPATGAGVSELVQRYPGLLITAVVAAVVLLIVIVLAIVWPDADSDGAVDEVVDGANTAGEVVDDPQPAAQEVATPKIGSSQTPIPPRGANSAARDAAARVPQAVTEAASRPNRASRSTRNSGRFDAPAGDMDRNAIDPNDPLAHLPVAKTYPADSPRDATQETAASGQRESVSAAPTDEASGSANYRLNISERLTPSGDDVLRVEVLEDCWIAIKSTGGDDLYGQLGRPGQTITLTGQGPFRVLLGYAPGAELYLDDRQIGLAPYTRNNVASLVIGQ